MPSAADEARAAIAVEEESLRARMLGLLDEARRALRRRAAGLEPDSSAAWVITQMLRAVEQAAARLNGQLADAVAGSRQRTLELGEQYALYTLPHSEAAVEYGLNPHLVETIARYEATQVTGLTAELRANVSRVVQVGMLSGASIADMSKELGLHVTKPLGPFRTAAARCEAIAVTETGKVANVATFARYSDAATRIPDLQKEWLTAGDGRVRPSHYLLNGVAIPMDADFNVGGYPAKYPQDERLPASEAARCRCTIRAIMPENEE